MALATRVLVRPEQASQSTALVARSPDLASLWDDVRLQKLWLAIERHPWRSLAVLGASKRIETIQTAELLAQLAWRYRGQPSGVCDLRDLTMRLIDYQVRELQAEVEAGTRLVVALKSIFENPTAIPIAKHTDAVVLCVALGETPRKAVEETIAAVGRDRIVGSIIMRPRRPKQRPPGANGRT
jgi:hypothetical protein